MEWLAGFDLGVAEYQSWVELRLLGQKAIITNISDEVLAGPTYKKALDRRMVAHFRQMGRRNFYFSGPNLYEIFPK